MRTVNILIALFLIVLGSVIAVTYLSKSNSSQVIQRQPTPMLTVGVDEKYVSGTITAFRNNLATDGRCAVTAGGVEIEITAPGEQKPGAIPNQGSVSGIMCRAGDDLSDYIGKKVEAFGKWNNGYYLSMVGNDNYFIKVESDSILPKPPVVDAFLCGDYCPGPAERHTEKVFQGVKDEVLCVKLGGTPGSFIAWGETKYCLAPKLQVCPQAWTSNRMPCGNGPDGCGYSETFVVNGEKFHENYVDVDWVQKNCSIKPSVSY